MPDSLTRTADQLAQLVAREMFAKDYAPQALGIRIDHVTSGSAVLSMTVRPNMVNGHGICHGGMIFTLADTAFAYACNSHNVATVAAAASIDFLAAGKLGDTLTAEAIEINLGRRSGLYDIKVTNQDGRLIAVFRGKSAGLDRPVVDNK